MSDAAIRERGVRKDERGNVRFGATPDRLTWGSTAVGVLVMIGGIAALVYQGYVTATASHSVLFFTLSGSLVALLLGLWSFAPRGYCVTRDEVVIRRGVYDIRIPIARIRSVQEIELHRVVRVCGVGGFLGTWGWFSSRELRWFRAYVTRRKPLVHLDIEGASPVVLSPDAAAQFIAELERRLMPPSP